MEPPDYYRVNSLILNKAGNEANFRLCQDKLLSLIILLKNKVFNK